jgi:transposase InsO family protein
VIDAYARRIVGWRVSRTAHAGFVLDALEQALHDPTTCSSRPARAQTIFAFSLARNGTPHPGSSFGHELRR